MKPPFSSCTTIPEQALSAAGEGRDALERVVTAVGSVLLGKQDKIRLALACLLARGHLLIEDLPGMGKTILAHALAQALGLSYNRIQFTSDVLPADVLGMNVFDRERGEFSFREGPIFAQVVLADEINRTTPKSQSALLEAMEEGQVTVDGQTRPLPIPYFVIATQNPSTQAGTYPLPESQLDRFLMRIELGYPPPEVERELMRGEDRREVLNRLTACLAPETLVELQRRVEDVRATDALLDYVQRLVEYSRQAEDFAFGLSPRGGLALFRASQSWALLDGRDYVIPEDIQAVLPSVVEHRLRESADHAGHGGGALARRLLEAVDVVA